MCEIIKMLEAAARVRPLSRPQLQLVHLHMTAAGVRTIRVDDVLFERVAAGLQLQRLPPKRWPEPDAPTLEDLRQVPRG